ncbi:MAG: MFS transporter, partial [Pirellulaceae bacterium]
MREAGKRVATIDPLTSPRRWVALMVVFLALVCDGIELGLMPVASLSVTQSLMGSAYDSVQGGRWFAWFTASLLLGAAVGGIALGWLGDWIGRTKALAISVLFYSLFAGLGAWVQTQEQMLVLRFLVGLGVGGVWPNGMTLVAELWPGTSKARIAGVMSAGLNAGILLLSQAVRIWPVTPSSWRWLFLSAALPVLLGILAWWV